MYRVIVDEIIDTTFKCWIVEIDGNRANFPKSCCEHEGGHDFLVPKWLANKIDQAYQKAA